MSTVRQGDFSELAKDYRHRPGYSEQVLRRLAVHVGATSSGFTVADVGAGTGKLTELLANEGLRGHAVEPNDAMRQEGIRAMGHSTAFGWRAGTAEATGLPAQSVDWVLMASAFHWTDQAPALAEFHRILKPGGFFTALWNPRHIERSPLEQQIEALIARIVPDLQRVSSGSRACTSTLAETLAASGHFDNLLFLEGEHDLVMDRSRYIGVWRSVNDVQSQAGPKRFRQIVEGIEELLGERDQVLVPYLTRAWTVQKKGV
jgi:ubiquinone/menaquinone biosynthesis C-methylase UbiE